MRLNTETLGKACVNKIVSTAGGLGTIGDALVLGVAASFADSGGAAGGPIPPHPASIEVTTGGECSVSTSTCVAGDWFTSNAAGLAVKAETGFALGRILADPIGGIALCVISPGLL